MPRPLVLVVDDVASPDRPGVGVLGSVVRRSPGSDCDLLDGRLPAPEPALLEAVAASRAAPGGRSGQSPERSFD